MMKADKFLNTLTLDERKQIFSPNNYSNNLTIKNRLEEWNKVKSLVSDKYFEERLDIENITKQEFGCLLKDPVESKDEVIKYIENLEWYKLFNKIFDYHFDREIEIEDNITMFLHPLKRYVEIELTKEITLKKNVAFDRSVIDNLLDTIMNTLTKIIAKNVVIELNRAKKLKQLNGADEKERFRNFLIMYCSTKNALIDFYYKYPVSTRLVITKVLYLIKFVKLAINRVDNHFEYLSTYFKIEPNNSIYEMLISNGDSHQKASSVVIYKFQRGERLIYKPRKLESEIIYLKIINWINSKGDLLPLYNMRVKNFDTYGFIEYIPYRECSDQTQIKNFYTRFGYLVALVYALKGGDFHSENMIANGEHPNLIDLETLFQNEFLLEIRETSTVKIKKEILLDTVLGSALLPLVIYGDNPEGLKGLDVSALNGGGDKLPFKVLMPKNLDNENFEFQYSEYTTEFTNNIPIIGNQKVKFTNYLNEIIFGFKQMYLFILDNKEEFLEQLNSFGDIQVRSILKGTNKYASLLEFSTHPNYSKDMLKREKLLENMWAFPYEDKRNIPSETSDMLFDDIPIFFTTTKTKDLIDSEGKVINNFFKNTSFELTQKRIEKMSKKDLIHQVSIIKVRLGMYLKYIADSKKRVISRSSNIIFQKENSALKYAKIIADYLMEKSDISNSSKNVSWKNINKVSTLDWEYGPLSINLYDGLAGLALFFFELYVVSDVHKYLVTYHQIMNEILKEIEYSNLRISGYTGKLSIVFTILNEIIKTGESKYTFLLEQLFKELKISMQNGEDIDEDWLGASSLIVLLIQYNKLYPSTTNMELANIIFERIVDSTNSQDNSLGMGHGLIGIIYASMQLYEITKQGKIQKFCNRLIEIVINEENKLNDLSWCKDIASLCFINEYIKDELKDKYQHIIKKVIDKISISESNNDSLCHGNAGEIELLIQMSSDISSDKEIDKLLYSKVSLLISKIEVGSLDLRDLPELGVYDLFTGIGGIGYTLLRSYSPNTVSNVLTLQLNK